MNLTQLLFEPLRQPLAYLDPGSGSFILQLILAAALGAAVALRLYWGKAKSFFKRMFTKDRDADDTPNADD